LSDLRESGSIEQDADVVMFVYREEYYLANKEPRVGTPEYEKWQLDMSLVHGKAEVIIGKQRHGPTGMVELAFEGQFTRFSDLAQDSHLPAQAY
jgi:replicative DNA helicase